MTFSSMNLLHLPSLRGLGCRLLELAPALGFARHPFPRLLCLEYRSVGLRVSLKCFLFQAQRVQRYRLYGGL